MTRFSASSLARLGQVLDTAAAAEDVAGFDAGIRTRALAVAEERLFTTPNIVLFTCGRRPAGHVMMSVVGVVGVVVVVVVGGGEQLLYMGPPRAHVWFSKIQ